MVDLWVWSSEQQKNLDKNICAQINVGYYTFMGMTYLWVSGWNTIFLISHSCFSLKRCFFFLTKLFYRYVIPVELLIYLMYRCYDFMFDINSGPLATYIYWSIFWVLSLWMIHHQWSFYWQVQIKFFFSKLSFFSGSSVRNGLTKIEQNKCNYTEVIFSSRL